MQISEFGMFVAQNYMYHFHKNYVPCAVPQDSFNSDLFLSRCTDSSAQKKLSWFPFSCEATYCTVPISHYCTGKEHSRDIYYRRSIWCGTSIHAPQWHVRSFSDSIDTSMHCVYNSFLLLTLLHIFCNFHQMYDVSVPCTESTIETTLRQLMSHSLKVIKWWRDALRGYT